MKNDPRAFISSPPKTKYLWKIIQFYKLKTLLDGGLWFSRLDEFGDEKEGTLPDLNIGIYNKSPDWARMWVLEQYDEAVLRSYAVCFHHNDDDPTQKAWDQFAFDGPNDTLAIRTSYDALKEALAPISGMDGPVHIRDITYINHEADTIPDHNILEAAFTVQRGYRVEQETRALIHLVGTAANILAYNPHRLKSPIQLDGLKYTGGDNGGKAIVVKIDPRQLIHEIVCHPDMDDEARQHIADKLAKYGMEGMLRGS